ncbi:OmpA family protein [Luteibaculum oceani]|uniref:OmpA family protein n=1 Tax=Luteibaculum oceani TaxID=1294296 RepID=A0A5C6UWM3_9FLAO|nr:OmpA family protein [Luteibaculum oceani]TXC77064.1 OmpA family protein [Luteibaculum oceani]
MNAFKIIFFSIVFLGLSRDVQAQDNELRLIPDWKIKSLAKTAEMDGNWYQAANYYEELLTRTGENQETLASLANVYWNSKDYLNASDYYYQLFQDYPEEGIYLLRYALLEKHLGKPESAIYYLERYQRKFLNKEPNEETYQLIRKEIEGCELAIKKGNFNPLLEVHRLPNNVNYPHVEISPFPQGDTLYYAAIRTEKLEYEESEVPVSKVYMAVETDSIWRVFNHNLPIANEKVNIGNLVFNDEKNELAYTQCERESPTYYRCEIYHAKKINGVWKEPEALKNVNQKKYTQTQPTFAKGPDGTQLIYFVSDQPGGQGGLDIWYVAKDKSGSYRKPKNCGKKLNTPGNETCPRYHNTSKTLYFSSNGLPGYGNMDIFSIVGYATKWASPQNLGGPINSGADDLYYVIKDSVSGFFTSNRPGVNSLQSGTCCDDIFRFRIKELVKVSVEGTVDFVIPGDDKSKVKVGLYKDLGEKNVLVAETTPNETGEYKFTAEPDQNYKILAEKDGYLKGMKDLSTKGVKKSKGMEVAKINLLPETNQPIVIRNIYYPFDKDYLTDASKITIDTTIFEILDANKTIKVEISSHTDWFGTDSYNEDLSQRRAQSVVDYLIKKGIPAERLVAKGYGEKQPIAPNQNPDGSDNPVGRAKNRRTEFRIVGYLPQYEEIIYEE